MESLVVHRLSHHGNTGVGNSNPPKAKVEPLLGLLDTHMEFKPLAKRV
jgi:hypothetical protein